MVQYLDPRFIMNGNNKIVHNSKFWCRVELERKRLVRFRQTIVGIRNNRGQHASQTTCLLNFIRCQDQNTTANTAQQSVRLSLFMPRVELRIVIVSLTEGGKVMINTVHWSRSGDTGCPLGEKFKMIPSSGFVAPAN